ncbi:hypothetical protein QVD17_30463 [Tagetes erecta]|uniref:Uncharacterized protein n=1 Tax=Tagetes erecta TaxID=13708 RepID=A0AAD8K3P8_TARER|nr:hypothetical protein QVD17_30463 [Tagetes erecta]
MQKNVDIPAEMSQEDAPMRDSIQIDLSKEQTLSEWEKEQFTPTAHLKKIEKLQVENEELRKRIANTDNLFQVCGLTPHDLIDSLNIHDDDDDDDDSDDSSSSSSSSNTDDDNEDDKGDDHDDSESDESEKKYGSDDENDGDKQLVVSEQIKDINQPLVVFLPRCNPSQTHIYI